MFGDVIKKQAGICNQCGSPVFIYSKEGQRCSEIRYTCGHSAGYHKEMVFDVADHNREVIKNLKTPDDVGLCNGESRK